MNANFILCMRSAQPQKALRMLLVKNGRVVWSKSVLGRKGHKRFSMKVLQLRENCVCCWVKGILAIDQGTKERKYILFSDALWISELSDLSMVTNIEGGEGGGGKGYSCTGYYRALHVSDVRIWTSFRLGECKRCATWVRPDKAQDELFIWARERWLPN